MDSCTTLCGDGDQREFICILDAVKQLAADLAVIFPAGDMAAGRLQIVFSADAAYPL